MFSSPKYRSLNSKFLKLNNLSKVERQRLAQARFLQAGCTKHPYVNILFAPAKALGRPSFSQFEKQIVKLAILSTFGFYFLVCVRGGRWEGSTINFQTFRIYLQNRATPPSFDIDILSNRTKLKYAHPLWQNAHIPLFQEVSTIILHGLHACKGSVHFEQFSAFIIFEGLTIVHVTHCVF